MASDNNFVNEESPSQKQQILDWMKKGKGITPLQALKMFGCFRLGARIFDLEKDGHNITTEMVEVKNEATGKKKRIARYWLNKPIGLFDK